MPLEIDFTDLDKTLKQLEHNIQSFYKTALKLAANTLVNLSVDAFSNPSVRIKPWPARKKETPQSLGKGLLIDSSDLFGSLRKDSKDKNYDPTTGEIGVKSHTPYALTHQFGRGPIPARPFVPITNDGSLTPHAQHEIQDEIKTTFEDYFGKNKHP